MAVRWPGAGLEVCVSLMIFDFYFITIYPELEPMFVVVDPVEFEEVENMAVDYYSDGGGCAQRSIQEKKIVPSVG